MYSRRIHQGYFSDDSRRIHQGYFSDVFPTGISALGYFWGWRKLQFYLRVESLPGDNLKPPSGPMNEARLSHLPFWGRSEGFFFINSTAVGL